MFKTLHTLVVISCLTLLSGWAIDSFFQELIHDMDSHMCFYFPGTNRRPSLERQTTLYDDQYYVDGYYSTDDQHRSIYRYCSIPHHHWSDNVGDRCLDLFLYCCHKHHHTCFLYATQYFFTYHTNILLDVSSVVCFSNTNISDKPATFIHGVQAVQVLFLNCLDPDDGSSKIV